jgi:ribosomal protein S12 methylthiotransferase accessory factor
MERRRPGEEFDEMELKARTKTKLSESLERANRLISSRTGIIRGLIEVPVQPDDFEVYNYYAFLAHSDRFSSIKASTSTCSAASTSERARMGAVGEAVERYCSSLYDTNEFTLATYQELGSDAVKPAGFGLFSPSQYTKEYFPYSPFKETTKIAWVEAYSLVHNKPLFVPACFTYMPYVPHPQETRIRDSNTTGQAAGSSLEEAILSGIYEVVERDAFTIMWLNRMSLPPVDLSSAKNEYTVRLLNSISSSNLKLTVNYITMDIEIPIFFAVLEDVSGGKPVAAVGAAADLNPESALLQTVEEVIQTRRWAKQLVEQRPYPFEDFSEIKQFEDHVIFYAQQERKKALDFIDNSKEPVKLPEIPDRSSENVLENILTCVKLISDKGMDVIVREITTTDILDAGFNVARVIVPGMVLVNGHFSFRYLGEKRLYDVPKLTGYRDKKPEEEDFNKYPHPFP